MRKLTVQYAWLCAVAAVLLLLASCGNMLSADRVIDQNHNEVESKKTKDAGNFDSMARALGCVFAPQSCKK